MVLLWATPASPDGVNVNPLASEAASPIDGWNVSPPIIVPEVLAGGERARAWVSAVFFTTSYHLG